MRKIVIILSVLAVIISACIQINTKKHSVTTNDTQFTQDTVVVKQRNALSNPTWGVLYSKSYSYYWLAGKDTLDFVINVTEYEKDNTFSLSVSHKDPMLFTGVLEKFEKCFPLIEEDFNLSKLTAFELKEPIFYLDLIKKLSSEYEQEFGQKNISYERLNQFLLKSSLTLQLNSFLNSNSLNKNVKSYQIEKFGLMEKKYYKEYLRNNGNLSNIDLAEYPEFTIVGMGLCLELENK